MEQQISGYLFFTTVMNAIFGVLIAAVMWLLGMPNPFLWGFVAGVTKFIPYLGGFVCTVVLTMASIVAFDDMWWALLVPAVFLAIDTVHGNVLLPLLLGKRFTLDPAVLFVGLFFWWFVWGTAGALLAGTSRTGGRTWPGRDRPPGVLAGATSGVARASSPGIPLRPPDCRPRRLTAAPACGLPFPRCTRAASQLRRPARGCGWRWPPSSRSPRS
jgi:hypothetical protein